MTLASVSRRTLCSWSFHVPSWRHTRSTTANRSIRLNHLMSPLVHGQVPRIGKMKTFQTVLSQTKLIFIVPLMNRSCVDLLINWNQNKFSPDSLSGLSYNPSDVTPITAVALNPAVLLLLFFPIPSPSSSHRMKKMNFSLSTSKRRRRKGTAAETKKNPLWMNLQGHKLNMVSSLCERSTWSINKLAGRVVCLRFILI